MYRELCASSQWGDSFGSSHLAMFAYGISAASPIQPTTSQRPVTPLYYEEMMAQFDRHFDNLASAVTNSGAALNKLAATTTTHYSDIKALLTSLKTAAVNGSHSVAASTAATPLTTQEQPKKRIQKLEAAMRNNWHRGAFCSAHGWGVNENHTSANFQYHKPGHIATSNRASAAGPGNTLNKGWDNFLPRRSSDRT